MRSGYGLVWIELAGITTPFINPQFPFLQTVTQRTLDNLTPAFTLAQGPSVAPLPLTADAGLGQGVFTVDRDLGAGYAQQWNLAVQRAHRPARCRSKSPTSARRSRTSACPTRTSIS